MTTFSRTSTSESSMRHGQEKKERPQAVLLPAPARVRNDIAGRSFASEVPLCCVRWHCSRLNRKALLCCSCFALVLLERHSNRRTTLSRDCVRAPDLHALAWGAPQDLDTPRAHRRVTSW